MTPEVRAITPIVFVSDVDVAMRFYELLGFGEMFRGDDGEWVWLYARCGDVSLLFATNGAAPEEPYGPAHMYFQTQDIDGLQERLTAGGTSFEHMGYPDHAPGGEIRLVDPDRHALVLAQTAGAGATRQPEDEPDRRSSILQRAAESVRRRGGAGQHCQVGERDGRRCHASADVKLTDSWGDTAWSCLSHADEVVIGARGVYLATEDAEGLGAYLSRRRRTDRPGPVSGQAAPGAGAS